MLICIGEGIRDSLLYCYASPPSPSPVRSEGEGGDSEIALLS